MNDRVAKHLIQGSGTDEDPFVWGEEKAELKMKNLRAELLRHAEQLVNNDRNTTYDDPTVDFARIAAFWSAYLGLEVALHDVAALMALLKLARIQGNAGHYDSWVDLAGYAACGWDCVDG